MVRFRLLTLAVGFTLLIAAAPATAATITVNTTNDDQTQGDGQCSLRKAIQDVDSPGSTQHDCAPAAFGANTIALGAGNYELGMGTGELSIGSTVTSLTIVGVSGETRTLIDGRQLLNRVFDIAAGASVVMRNLTIANGMAPNGMNGGGILNQGTLTLIDSVLSGNRAGVGEGGSYPAAGGDGGPGSAGGSGGGVYSSGALTLNGVTLSNNQSGAGGSGGAGGLGPQAGAGGAGAIGGAGGGVMNAGGSLTVENSTFRSNQAGSGGAGGSGGSGVNNGSAGGSGGAGGTGGALESDGGSLSVTNSTFASNSAGSGGAGGAGGNAGSGGVAGAGGAGGAGGVGGSVRVVGTSGATLLQTTFAGNNAGMGGTGGSGGGGATGLNGPAGGAGSGGGPSAQGATITLQNSLLALNGGANCGTGILDGGHNLSWGDTTCPSTFASGDPNLGPLQDNGGPSPTIELQPGSAAIDQIPATGAGCTAMDERGVKRPSGPECDIGAYEVAPPSATTLPASRVTRSSAFLNASVTPNAGGDILTFQYGRTKKYGSASRNLGKSGVTPIGVTWRVGKLKANTTYHYRVVITTADGTSYGADRTFTTTVAVIKHLKVSPFSFSRHTTVTYTDSKRATTTLSVLRCVTRHGKCARYVYVTRFTHHDRAGRNRVTLSTRIGRHRLSPGKYRLELTPKFKGNLGATTSTSFRVT